MQNFNIYRSQIKEMMSKDYSSFIQALVSIETGEANKETLQALYDLYMHNDDVTLINEFFHKF